MQSGSLRRVITAAATAGREHESLLTNQYAHATFPAI